MTIYYPGNRDQFGNQGIFPDGAGANQFGKFKTERMREVFSWKGAGRDEIFFTTTTSGGVITGSITASGLAAGSTALIECTRSYPIPAAKSTCIIINGSLGPARFATTQFIGFHPNFGFSQINNSGVTTYNVGTTSRINWNLDKLDGTGLSGVTVDFSNLNTYVIEIIPGYKIRYGVIVSGRPIFCHEDTYTGPNSIGSSISGLLMKPRASTVHAANASGTSACTLNSVSIWVEGGYEHDNGYKFSVNNGVTSRVVTGTSLGPLISFVPKTFNNSFLMKIHSIEIFSNGTNALYWALVQSSSWSQPITHSDLIPTSLLNIDKSSAHTPSGTQKILRSGYVSAQDRINRIDLSDDGFVELFMQSSAAFPWFLTLMAQNVSAGNANVLAAVNWTEYY